jgi:hypothetical protein
MRLLVMLLPWLAAAGQDFSRELPPLAVDLRTPPSAVRSDGQFLIIYELHLTNWGSKTIELKRIEVLGPRPPAVLEGESLVKAFPRGAAARGTLPSGRTTVVLLAVPSEQSPESLEHRIHFTLGDDPQPVAVEHKGAPVVRNSIRIGAPLRGELWVTSNGPAGNNHHTGGLLPYRGRIRVPQRFAFDLVQVRPDGRTHNGDPRDNRNYHCYGAEALAVADARVADVRDGIPENSPGPTERAVKMTLDTVTGNRVVLDLGRGRFAHYAHLQPGSLRVRRGEKVRQGQTLGLVGNSGNSTEPHLHFQVSDSASILEGDGLPFVIDSFLYKGKLRRDELPRDSWVVSFGVRPR